MKDMEMKGSEIKDDELEMVSGGNNGDGTEYSTSGGFQVCPDEGIHNVTGFQHLFDQVKDLFK